jgi:hypothetical protein
MQDLRSRLRAGVLLLVPTIVMLSMARDVSPQRDISQPPLSSTALLSRFARVHGLASGDELRAIGPRGDGSFGQAPEQPAGLGPLQVKVNQDYSGAPQNETTIAINPTAPNMLVAGANDYRLGVPVGAAFYTSFDGGLTWTDGFPPFPLLAGEAPGQSDEELAAASEVSSASPAGEGENDPDRPSKGNGQFIEAPYGTGDPVVAFGYARLGSPDLIFDTPTAYYAYLGVSGAFCEHGIFVSRSTNGLTWTRPVVPTLLPPDGLYTPVYWPHPDDCSVFNDKPWIATDTSNGPHRGRVYVVWARFLSSDLGFRQSTIMMSYSDDNAETWSAPRNISGFSNELCPAQVSGKSGRCDESQFATAAVGPDGTLHVAFINQQAKGDEDGFRNQYLTVLVNPDTFAVTGPYHAASMIDGKHDLPRNGLGQATLCNANFRLNTAGNVALDPSDATGRTMYIVFADNRNGSSFPDHDMVAQVPPDTFTCPNGKNTDLDIFLVRSTDGGATWSEPVRVNQDPVGGGKDQWFPFVAVGPDGRVSVVFHDRRDDPFNRFANVYFARSSNGGGAWSETKLTGQSSNLNWAFDNGFFIGDYNAVAVGSNGTSYPFWTDSRNGEPTNRQSDVYMAIVPP